MERNEIFLGVVEILKDIFDDDDLEIEENTCSEDIEDWDSLEYINIIVAVEKKFNVKFSVDDIKNIENVGAMVNLVERKMLN